MPTGSRSGSNTTRGVLSLGERASYRFHDLHPDTGTFLEDVLTGLALPVKALPPKYFYDARGSELFEAICDLPEYYPTRTELAMMRDHAAAMAQRMGPRALLIEYGAGSGRKTRLLIEAAAPAAYVAVDISSTALRQCARQLAQQYPAVPIEAVCADYTHGLALPEPAGVNALRRVIYFPGSTVGNFTPTEALQFLREARVVAGPGGAMLVGVDLKKDPARLHAAYNDAQGVTAAFNLNLLTRINRELGGNFDVTTFEHHAFYDKATGRIEMHLRSRVAQRVSVAGHTFEFRAGETLHTENSCKYSASEFQQLARDAGFEPLYCWVDAEQLFSVHFLEVPH